MYIFDRVLQRLEFSACRFQENHRFLIIHHFSVPPVGRVHQGNDCSAGRLTGPHNRIGDLFSLFLGWSGDYHNQDIFGVYPHFAREDT